MGPNIIVSYDGTETDADALAFGRLLARAGASLTLAYVRHTRESERRQEELVQHDADDMLRRGAEWLGSPDVACEVVLSGSTPEGLRALAERVKADAVLFGSEYRTAPGHVDPQRSARQLLDGGPIAVGIATSGLHERGDPPMTTIGFVSENGDPSARETAESLATAFGAELATRAARGASLLVVGSKPGGVAGRVMVSAAAEYLIETVTSPVLVVPRGVAMRFEAVVASA